jgi:predicted MPP superfamily phosphohydrolase
LVSSIDLSRITVMMDHQPYKLDSTAKYNIDLQISGHTHRGQLWPFSLIVDKIYELSHGYIQKGNTHFYVSQGFGTWGPPVRIGTTPDIALITIRSR